MPAVFSHEHVRDLAKRLGKRLGREVKHTEIIEDMAAVFGLRPDAFMHKLKHEGTGGQSLTPTEDVAPVRRERSQADVIADVYEFWRSEMEIDGYVSWLVTARGSMGGAMCILVTTEHGNPYEADPEKPIWTANLVYRDAMEIVFVEGRQTSVGTLEAALKQSAELKDGHSELFKSLYGASLDKPSRDRHKVDYEQAKDAVLEGFGL